VLLPVFALDEAELPPVEMSPLVAVFLVVFLTDVSLELVLSDELLALPPFAEADSLSFLLEDEPLPPWALDVVVDLLLFVTTVLPPPPPAPLPAWGLLDPLTLPLVADAELDALPVVMFTDEWLSPLSVLLVLDA
jgi:hypothetical protein